MHPRTYHSDADIARARFREDVADRRHVPTKPRLLPVEKEWSPYPVAKEQK